MNSVFKKLITFQFSVSYLMIAFSLYRITNYQHISAGIVATMCFISVLVELTFLCYPGNEASIKVSILSFISHSNPVR